VQFQYIDSSLCNTSVSGLEMQSNFRVYPNPTNGILTVTSDMPFNTNVRAEVLDVFGKNLFREQPLSGMRFDLNLERLLPGVYFIRLSTDEFSATRRFTMLR
jgi:hypothetical protein